MSTSPRSLAPSATGGGGGGLARASSFSASSVGGFARGGGGAASVVSSAALSQARHEHFQHTRVAEPSKLDNLLRLPRRTPSVRSVLERAAGQQAPEGAEAVLQRLFARLALGAGALEGGVVRALVHERMAVLARVFAEQERLEAAAAAGAEPDAEVLGYLKSAALANAKELRRRIGAEAAADVFAVLRSDEVRAAYALAVPSEDAAMAEAVAEAEEAAAEAGVEGGGSAAVAGSAAERAARIWRRKLAALASTFTSAGGALTSHGSPRHLTHDSRTHLGHRALHNDLNMRTAKDNMSYFQLAQLKYGRGRRGSTSIAGAWEEVFDRNGNVTAPTGGGGGGGGGGTGADRHQPGFPTLSSVEFAASYAHNWLLLAPAGWHCHRSTAGPEPFQISMHKSLPRADKRRPAASSVKT